MHSFSKTLGTVSAALILLCAVSSCTSQRIASDSVASRALASVDDTDRFENEFQNILRSEDPAAATKVLIDRSVSLFYRTQALLNDYDARLDQLSAADENSAKAAMTDDSYAKLAAAWSLREENHSEIRYFYSRALQVSNARGNDSKTDRDVQNRALMMSSSFKRSLIANANPTDQIAKQDLLLELIEMHGDLGILNKQVIPDAKRLTRFFIKNQTSMNLQATAAKFDPQFDVELEQRFPEMKQHLVEQYESRLPQSEQVYEIGSGPHGAMNGNSFRPGRWALTFDDGPHVQHTLKVLANLKSYNMKATFFWLAKNIGFYPSVVAQVKNAGMVLANHSYSHPQLTKLGPAGLSHEIEDSTQADTKAYGFKPEFFRCPYGACGPSGSAAREMIARQGMLSVIWNVDSLDWQDKNPTSVYLRVKKQMALQKKGIILFHDIHPQSVIASKMVMADLAAGEQSGQYRVLTVQQARDEMNSPAGMQ